MQWDLAAKYLTGECTSEERRRFEEWLAEDPERVSGLEALRPYVVPRARKQAPVDVAAAWTALSARIERDSPRVESGRKRAGPGVRRWREWGLAAAAVLVIATGAAVAILQYLPGSAPTTVTTRAGEKRQISLADGSRIVVAPLSRIELRGLRSATLVGEAYFVVVHDSRRPFTVETNDAVIEDLGTSFVVRAGSAGQSTFVAVEEGVVSLAPASSGGRAGALVLREGESGTISRAGAIRGDSALWSRGLAWTRGEIVFDDTPMRDVVRELSRWFGVTVALSDPSLTGRTLSARLSGERIEEALEAIDRSLGVRHTRSGDTVLVSP